jgi:hypothetical protein
MLQYLRMRTSLGWIGCALLAVVVSACSSSPPHPRYVAQPSAALTSVPIAPPPARVEAVPPSPAKGAVWIDGEWTYRRGRWAWILGRWVTPAPRTAFSPWAIVRDSKGDLFHAPGVWRDDSGLPIDPPSPLAFASAQAGPVVDAEGVTEPTGRTVKSVSTPDGGLIAPQPLSSAPPPSESPPPASVDASTPGIYTD